EAQLRVGDPRPGEARVVLRLARVGAVGERQRVAGAPVKALLEGDDVSALLSLAGRQVLARLPVDGRFEGVLDGDAAALDEEDVLELAAERRRRKAVDEAGVLHRVDVAVARLVERYAADLVDEGRGGELLVVEAERSRGEEAEEIEVVDAALGIVQ